MCEHKRLRTRGHRVFCCQCGAELSLDFLMNQGKPAEPVQDPGQKPDQTIIEGTQPEPEQPDPAPDPVEQEPDASKPTEKAENPAKGKPGRKPTGKSTTKNKAAKIAD